MQIKQMSIHTFSNPKPKTHLGGTSSKNPLRDGLVKPVHKFAKLVTGISSKMRDPKTYGKAINDYIYGNK